MLMLMKNNKESLSAAITSLKEKKLLSRFWSKRTSKTLPRNSFRMQKFKGKMVKFIRIGNSLCQGLGNLQPLMMFLGTKRYLLTKELSVTKGFTIGWVKATSMISWETTKAIRLAKDERRYLIDFTQLRNLLVSIIHIRKKGPKKRL